MDNDPVLISILSWDDSGGRFLARWRTHDSITFSVLCDQNGRPLHSVSMFGLVFGVPKLTPDQMAGAVYMSDGKKEGL